LIGEKVDDSNARMIKLAARTIVPAQKYLLTTTSIVMPAIATKRPQLRPNLTVANMTLTDISSTLIGKLLPNNNRLLNSTMVATLTRTIDTINPVRKFPNDINTISKIRLNIIVATGTLLFFTLSITKLNAKLVYKINHIKSESQKSSLF
tara:strand:- start:36 stop:485 length:450 start_codon:yes stop_codon:yes gene_type:complete